MCNLKHYTIDLINTCIALQCILYNNEKKIFELGMQGN